MKASHVQFLYPCFHLPINFNAFAFNRATDRTFERQFRISFASRLPRSFFRRKEITGWAVCRILRRLIVKYLLDLAFCIWMKILARTSLKMPNFIFQKMPNFIFQKMPVFIFQSLKNLTVCAERTYKVWTYNLLLRKGKI